jgi:cell division protein FtsQ
VSGGRSFVRSAPGLARALRRDGAIRLGRPAAAALRRPQPRTLAALVAVLVLGLAGWFWLRDSSLVAVHTVQVSGIGGAEAPQVRAALEQAARSMTTLHVRREALDSAVAPFSVVRDLEVSTGFPHTLRIHVVTNVAVGALAVDGRRIAVTFDGTLLRDVSATAGLPMIQLRSAPGGRRLTDPPALAAVAALGAAPAPLRSRVSRALTTRAHGLTIQLAHGPVLWLGDATRLGAKWAAIAAVLADKVAAGASYVDVTVPERPAAGGLAGGTPATGSSDVPTPPAGTTAGAGAPASVPPAGAATTPTQGTATTGG